MKKLATILMLFGSLAATREMSGSEHWSLQPLRRPPVPRLVVEGARNPIDFFIAEKLAARGLTMSKEAAPAMAIRRLHYLLTGLPPSPESAATFEKQRNYDEWVARLLDSPAYGERWARHWLDVVRFAESHGFEMNQPRNAAWRYRDYVIRAFNDDKPYDQFVRQQIAGDVFGDDDATGFLVAGAWDQVKSPDPVLTANQRADELHDMISTTGTAFLGLTIGCARCHDHKFDPIPQVDYFAIKAVFEGVEHGERARTDADAERTRKKIAQLRERIVEIEGAADELEPIARPESTNALRQAVNPRRNVERLNPTVAKQVRFTVQKTTEAEPCLDELEIYSSDGVNVALASAGTTAKSSGTYPDSEIHRLEHINDGKHGNSRSWISHERGKGWVELEFPNEVSISKIVWGRDREERFKDRLAIGYTIEVGNDAGVWRVVASSSDRQKPGEKAAVTNVSAELHREREALFSMIAALESELTAYAGRFKAEPEPTHRFHRGDPLLKRERVDANALRCIDVRFERDTRGGKLTEDQARRVAFAEWVTSRENPLTARVMVNRIWQYHFGMGLVSTASDFGLNGGRPSHPELLDWLAAEFMESGWSVKHLQRLIVTSATFRQASAVRADGAEVDASSRQLWRFPPRRLEAEAIRDTVLAVSGTLEARMSGAGFSFFEANENYVRVYTPRENWPRETFRRMIYGTVIRQRSDGVFGVFDCPDAGQITPRRTSSTTPLQALNLLNSSFLNQQAGFFAERLERECPNDRAAQIRRAFALTFQREPNAAELQAALEFTASENLELFCRSLLNANELVYLY